MPNISSEKNKKNFAGVPQLSLRGLLLGVLGSCVITASSMYVALRMSALPWPTIFVAVLSMALLKSFGKTDLNEINITQTAMSAGAMIAGGLAFTLPGFWITGRWSGTALTGDRFWQTLAIALAGMILGTVLTWFLRQKLVEGEALPYPIGAAAAETIKVGDAGGRKSILLFGAMGFSAVFTLLRDGLGLIPATFSATRLYARNFYLGIWVSPMAAGIGYLIGSLYTGVWFAGAIFSYLIIIPIGTALKVFSTAAAAVEFKNTAGIGLMVGTGVGIFIAYLTASLKKLSIHRLRQSRPSPGVFFKTERKWSMIALAAVFVCSVAGGLGPLPSILLMLGTLAASTMAATITGQTGINPMEIFGIIVLLAIRLVIVVDTSGAFLIAAVVAVACGYSGDLLNDYKAGQIIGTNPVAQLISQLAGGIAGTVIAVLAMFAVIGQFGGVGPDKGLPAGQAFAVSQMVNGIGNPLVFGMAASAGALFYLLKIPAMTLGIGMYLPFEISAMMFLGGLARLITDRTRIRAVETGNIAASGMLGGEGITGVGIAIFKMISGG